MLRPPAGAEEETLMRRQMGWRMRIGLACVAVLRAAPTVIASRGRRVFACTGAIFLVLGVVTSAAAPGSRSEPRSNSAAAASGTVVVRMPLTWTTLDVQKNGLDSQLDYAGYDRLLAFGPGGKLIPYLAKSWKVTPKSVTFKLRTDATCTDGTKITPTVVRNSFQRYLDPKTGAPLRTKFFGPGPYKVSANDKAGTFTFRTETPYELLPPFAHALSSIICPAGLVNPSRLANKQFGSGPYVLSSLVPGVSATFKVRPEWKWGPSGTTARDLPQTLVVKVITNDTTAANLLLTKGLDIAAVAGPDIARLKNNKSLKIKITSNFETHPLLYNMAPGHPTTDIAVRKALSTAVDAKVWNQLANYGGYGIVSTSLFVPGTPCFDPGTAKLIPKTSTDAARSILLADGYTMQGGKLVKNGSPLKIVFINFPGYADPAAAEYVLEQYTKVGIDATLSNRDATAWYDQLSTGNFDVSFLATGPFFPVLAYGSSWAHGVGDAQLPSNGGQNFGRINDPILESYRNAALNSIGKKSCGYWVKYQERLLGQYYVLPTAANQYLFFSDKTKIDYIPMQAFLEPYSIRLK
jgi:peptide/nickel transport system substrate-binding protein